MKKQKSKLKLKSRQKQKSSMSGIEGILEKKEPITRFELMGVFIFAISILITLDAPASMGILICYFVLFTLGGKFLRNNGKEKII